MGFWKKLFGIEEETENDTTNQDNLEFVTREQEQSFEDSMYGQLQLYDAEVEYIREVLPERGEALQKQIELLTKLLEVKNDESDLEVRDCFFNLKKQYEEDKRLADGEYTIRELEAQRDSMNQSFEYSLGNGGITKAELDGYISYIGMVQKKVVSNEVAGTPILTNVQRQKFSSILLRIEYRIKMLELMYLLGQGEVTTNPFRDLSVTKQKIFSKLFWEDAKKAQFQYEYLSYSEELFNKYNSGYFKMIDEMAKKLNEQMKNVRMVEDFSIRQLFDSNMSESISFDFLKEFISFKTILNEMRDKKQEFQDAKDRDDEVQRQEEAATQMEKAKEQEKMERLKNMTDSEICKKIDEIHSDLTATGNRFINIYEFQKRVAKAKGLLDSNIDIQNDELCYRMVGPITLEKILKNANTRGVNYIVYPNSQESNEAYFMFVVSSSDQYVTKVTEDEMPFRKRRYGDIQELLGTFDIAILKMISSKMEDKKYFSAIEVSSILYNLNIGRSTDKPFSNYESARKSALRAISEVKSELVEFASSEEDIQNILCYLQVPAMRNIIPILQRLKTAGIEVFLEPVPKKNRNNNNRENIHIYFRREDLEKVNEILGEISEQGVVTVKADKNVIGKVMIERAKWPDEREK